MEVEHTPDHVDVISKYLNGNGGNENNVGSEFQNICDIVSDHLQQRKKFVREDENFKKRLKTESLNVEDQSKNVISHVTLLKNRMENIMLGVTVLEEEKEEAKECYGINDDVNVNTSKNDDFNIIDSDGNRNFNNVKRQREDEIKLMDDDNIANTTVVASDKKLDVQTNSDSLKDDDSNASIIGNDEVSEEIEIREKKTSSFFSPSKRISYGGIIWNDGDSIMGKDVACHEHDMSLTPFPPASSANDQVCTALKSGKKNRKLQGKRSN